MENKHKQVLLGGRSRLRPYRKLLIIKFVGRGMPLPIWYHSVMYINYWIPICRANHIVIGALSAIPVLPDYQYINKNMQYVG